MLIKIRIGMSNLMSGVRQEKSRRLFNCRHDASWRKRDYEERIP